ncbi:TlpA family protein disulfide reductase [Tumebacillus lipolyticus]|uniref:TlpA family protein disulfide reductase n=1 Tax=Tumebacillus lipolyticus TaxID=1280370 RepID=A0ABW4ZVH0_9BACL
MDTFVTISIILLWVFMIAQMVVIYFLAKLVAGFLNRFRLIQPEVEYLKIGIGQQAPMFREKDQHGNLIKLSDLQGRPTMLLFVRESCNVCKRVLPELSVLATSMKSLRIIVITGTDADGPSFELPGGIHLLRSDEIFENYYIRKVPEYVLVGGDGNVLLMDSATDFDRLFDNLKYHVKIAG